MKLFSILTIVLLLSSCQRPKNTFIHNGIEISEEYILIEFASKLEEDYHKLESEKINNHHNHEEHK